MPGLQKTLFFLIKPKAPVFFFFFFFFGGRGSIDFDWVLLEINIFC